MGDTSVLRIQNRDIFLLTSMQAYGWIIGTASEKPCYSKKEIFCINFLYYSILSLRISNIDISFFIYIHNFNDSSNWVKSHT